MTPCEKLGYKVGDRFEVVDNSHGWGNNDKGDILRLHLDHGDEFPMFINESRGGSKAWALLNDIRPLKPEWDGTGLPPVGAVVRYVKRDQRCGHCGDGEVLAIHGGWAWLSTEDGHALETIDIHDLSPIRTERDKAIDELSAFLINEGWSAADSKDAAELYDKGLRLAHQIKPQHREG